MHDTTSLVSLSEAAAIEETTSRNYKLAQEMYNLGTPPETISKALGIMPIKVKKWIVEHDWANNKPETTALELVSEASPTLLAQKTVSKLTKVIYKAAEEYDRKFTSGDIDLTPRDLDRLTAVLINLDKIVRLETGKATEITMIQAIDYQEARKILRDDPFAKSIVDDCEYEVIDGNRS